MAETLISPGVLARENDSSFVTARPIERGAAIIGPTVKGPIEKPTLISSYSSFQAIFGVLASIIVMGFSRYREYRADSGGADLAGRQKMIAALERLKSNRTDSQLDGQLTAFGISGKRAWSELFMSHPPLEKRIAALQQHSN